MPIKMMIVNLYPKKKIHLLSQKCFVHQVTMAVSSVLEGVKYTNALWLGVILLIVYKLVTWYRRYTEWVAVYDRLPGKREKHWLWGHIHEVRLKNS